MGQLPLAGPRVRYQVVGAGEAVLDGQAEYRSRERLAYRRGLKAVAAVAPLVEQVTPASDDGAPPAARMILSRERRTPRTQRVDKAPELACIQPSVFGRYGTPVLLRVGDPVRYIYGVHCRSSPAPRTRSRPRHFGTQVRNLIPIRFNYAANYHTVEAGLKPALSLPWDANTVTFIYGSIMSTWYKAVLHSQRTIPATGTSIVGRTLPLPAPVLDR